MESTPTGKGRKIMPCTNFFSTCGCPDGDRCRFLHYVPGGVKVVKTRLCNKYNTAEGCRFGDECLFAHGGWELRKPPSFGPISTTKLSVDASLAGAIIGKHGGNQKRIWRVTGAHFSIRAHETDPNLRNIEFEGTCNQINDAIAMVREQIEDISQVFRPNNFKTKLCKKFAIGSCTFGSRCRFAHGAEELRWPRM